MSLKKIVLFGGSFDPVHLGHIQVAAAAAQYIGADKTVFIPAKHSPLKIFPPNASDIDRLEMIKLAIADHDNFEVSDCELKRRSPSYTLDTVRKFQNTFGGECSIYWLVGADSMDELARWHDVVELIDECNLAVMYRAGFDKPDFTGYEKLWGRQRIEKLHRNIIPTPLIDISSTDIRSRLAAGRDVTQMLNSAVLSYVLKHDLYKSNPTENEK
jgi:nicotinate-nucleotide adenylyltransferase